jgi:hypothetical protein
MHCMGETQWNEHTVNYYTYNQNDKYFSLYVQNNACMSMTLYVSL